MIISAKIKQCKDYSVIVTVVTIATIVTVVTVVTVVWKI